MSFKYGERRKQAWLNFSAESKKYIKKSKDGECGISQKKTPSL